MRKQAGSFYARGLERDPVCGSSDPAGHAATTTANAGKGALPRCLPSPRRSTVPARPALPALPAAPRGMRGDACPCLWEPLPAGSSPAPSLSFAFPAPLTFDLLPPPAQLSGCLSDCQLILFSSRGFCSLPRSCCFPLSAERPKAPLHPPSRRLPRDTRCAFNHAAPLRTAAARARSAEP